MVPDSGTTNHEEQIRLRSSPAGALNDVEGPIQIAKLLTEDWDVKDRNQTTEGDTDRFRFSTTNSQERASASVAKNRL